MASDIEDQGIAVNDGESAGIRAGKMMENRQMIRAVALTAFYVALSPLLCLVGLVLFSLPKRIIHKLLSDEEDGIYLDSSKWTAMGIYAQARHKMVKIGFLGSLRAVSGAALLLLVWLGLTIIVPSLKRVRLMWKWSLLASTLTCGSMEALMLVFALQFILEGFATFYYSQGLMMSMALVIYTGLVLLSWVLYFGTDEGLHIKHAELAFVYVTWTCVSLFVGSILWLLKAILLLRWRSDAIYGRFEARILLAGVKCYYLSLLVDHFEQKEVKHLSAASLRLIQLKRHDDQDPDKLLMNVSSGKAETHLLARVAELLASLAHIVKSREEDGIPHLMEWCRHNIPGSHPKCELDDLRKLFPSQPRDKMATLYDIIREEYSSDTFTFDELKKWMVDAHKDCINLGRTLADAEAIVRSLDILISCVIFVAMVIFWLLITGSATTKVLVTVATPFLAFTFLFGDTAKTFFQGIIFVFVSHPFDVGDRCVLDESELEVKSFGVMTTTFIKIGTKEKIMYPNSVLATKAIVNLGWQPDPTDVVELTLDSSSKLAHLQVLRQKIKGFLSANRTHYHELHKVMIKEIGDKIKLTIHFSHVLGIKEVTHSQCLEKKNEQRSDFLNRIKGFLDELSNEDSSRTTNSTANEIQEASNNGVENV